MLDSPFIEECYRLDAVFALRTLSEAYRERRRALHVAFLDLQKAFDCIPRQAIWWALRFKGIPEAYVDIIRDMYRDSVSFVRTAVGESNVFPISVGVHQGSALSPFLFNVVLDVVTANIQDQPPWLMMYADDIALVNQNKAHLERRVNIWKDTLENSGLRLNVAKTEYMSCGGTDSSTIRGLITYETAISKQFAIIAQSTRDQSLNVKKIRII